FDRQAREYQDQVLPPAVTARVSVEAGRPMGWHRWVGSAGETIGIGHFGASAPASEIFNELGFTPENVVNKARVALGLESPDASLESGAAAAGPARHGTDEN
ncbi:MAG: transketolase, partial [Gemmatimonadetes bacterium]|nr:transketolase [Gemmatimonadota bacterium]